MNRVLIVDDEQDILEIVSLLLKKNNFDVMTIARGSLIQNAIKSFSPDLILLDVALAGEDGREICRRLKLSEETMHIPVILFSAHFGLLNDVQECLANGLVTKPFESAHLIDIIRKHVDSSPN